MNNEVIELENGDFEVKQIIKNNCYDCINIKICSELMQCIKPLD